MIEIKILDKNGIELKNGDTVKYVSMTPYYQDEDIFFRFQSGVVIKYDEYIIDAQSEINEFGVFSIPMPYFDKDLLVDLFECGKDNQDEYESVLMNVCDSLGFDYTNEIEFYKKINGLEVVI